MFKLGTKTQKIRNKKEREEGKEKRMQKYYQTLFYIQIHIHNVYIIYILYISKYMMTVASKCALFLLC